MTSHTRPEFFELSQLDARARQPVFSDNQKIYPYIPTSSIPSILVKEYDCTAEMDALDQALGELPTVKTHSITCKTLTDIQDKSIALEDKLLDCVDAFKYSLDAGQKENIRQTEWFKRLQTQTPFYVKNKILLAKPAHYLSHHNKLDRFSVHRIAKLNYHFKSRFKPQDANLIHSMRNCAITLHSLQENVQNFIALFNSTDTPSHSI